MANLSDLFSGAASYYSHYRPPYPEQLFRRIVKAFDVDGNGRLLDVGCGPGTFTMPLRCFFKEIVAIDSSAEMVREAEMQARMRDAAGIDWRVLRAEEISAELGRFDLVTIASAFHWMDRDLVLTRCYEVLEPGGGLVITGGISSWWESTIPWQRAVISVVKDWLGPGRRAGSGVYQEVEKERFEESLARSDFEVFEQDEISYTHIWDIDSIIGLLYSTSFANRSLLGVRATGFEEELRQTLEEMSVSGRFQDQLTFDYFFARKA